MSARSVCEREGEREGEGDGGARKRDRLEGWWVLGRVGEREGKTTGEGRGNKGGRCPLLIAPYLSSFLFRLQTSACPES